MRSYADLELGLHPRDADSYSVELRFNAPDSDADVRLVRGDSLPVQFDTEIRRCKPPSPRRAARRRR